MTTIKFEKNRENEIVGFTASGHTNYGVEGEDIVCAAASSIMQTAALGILMVAETEAKINRDDKKAYFAVKLPELLSPTQRRDCNIILRTMMVGLDDLATNYSDFVELDGLK